MKKNARRVLSMLLTAILLYGSLQAQNDTIPVADNLVSTGMPPLPASIVSDVSPYSNFRRAFMVTWHPVKKEMLITTRFENTYQLHWVKMPGGDRKQVTFFDEPVRTASFNPVNGNYFLFERDAGGNEFTQIYRYDVATGKSALLTDGKRAINDNIVWNERGDKIVYRSTHRNSTDRDIYIMNPLDTASNKLLVENAGGGWGVDDWSKDEKKLLLEEHISSNEMHLWLYDFATGNKLKLLPKQDERAVYTNAFFSKDGKGVYLITDKDNEFLKLAYYDIATGNLSVLTAGINWNVDAAAITKDGKQIAFVINEAGISNLYIMNTATKKYAPVTAIRAGVITDLQWHNDSKSVAFSFTTSTASNDVFEWNTATGKLTRWTESELGSTEIAALEPAQLIKWKSFDGREISGFLYKASSKFSGKRPSIIFIHGGPEDQIRPVFQGSYNYFMNELGINLIVPNVRGSTGYGKTFMDLDNGMKREDALKDIGALLDWITTQPNLDPDRVMITGGSYGGYMTLACATHYSDKVRCFFDLFGPSDFNTYFKNTESYRRDIRRAEFGDERDTAVAAFFEKTAPLNNTDKITKPIFIVAGKNDPRVAYTESKQIADKISSKGGTVWFLMANDEGHGFAKKNNSDFLFYATVEFVKKCLINE